MSDNVSDVTGELLKAIRDEMRAGFASMNERFARVDGEIAELKVAIAALSSGQKIMKDEMALIRESQKIVEHDITGIKIRIDRIENTWAS
jgi:hypothetical protein